MSCCMNYMLTEIIEGILLYVQMTQTSLLVYNVKFIENSNMWYDFRIDSNNSREYLDVTKLHKSINYVDALPGIYTFTGHDYTPAFYRKGKIKPITLMCRHERFINAFKCLGEMPLTSDVIEIIEEYTCHIYGYTKIFTK